LVIKLPVTLEEEAGVQHGLVQHAIGDELQDEQEPADTTVPVEERVNRFELYVGQPRFEQGSGRLRIIVEEPLQIPQAVGQSVRRRRYERRVSWSRATYPHLAAAYLARRLCPALWMVEKFCVSRTQ